MSLKFKLSLDCNTQCSPVFYSLKHIFICSNWSFLWKEGAYHCSPTCTCFFQNATARPVQTPVCFASWLRRAFSWSRSSSFKSHQNTSTVKTSAVSKLSKMRSLIPGAWRWEHSGLFFPRPLLVNGFKLIYVQVSIFFSVEHRGEARQGEMPWQRLRGPHCRLQPFHCSLFSASRLNRSPRSRVW